MQKRNHYKLGISIIECVDLRNLHVPQLKLRSANANTTYNELKWLKNYNA